VWYYDTAQQVWVRDWVSGMPELANKRREKFCREYITDFNGAAAARRAGYSHNGANAKAANLLAEISVMDRVAELSGEAAERSETSVDWILAQLKKEAMEAPTDGARVRALELLGKYHAMFLDRHQAETSAPLSHEQVAADMARACPGLTAEQYLAVLRGTEMPH